MKRIIFFFLMPFFGMSQTLRESIHLSIDKGLLQNTVWALEEDYAHQVWIGTQAEMYQEGEARTLPVDMGLRKDYHRVLKFEIPEGYKLANTETIEMSVKAKEEDGTVYADFISSYTIQGNILTVICDERYHKIHYPVSQYEDYRKVINAAADFNKIVIYLEEI